MKKVINIEGMSCSHCVNRVQNALKDIKGVQKVEVDLENHCAMIETSEDIKEEIIKDALDDAGYDMISIN